MRMKPFVQTSQLEVIVTGKQHIVTFSDVPEITEEPESNEQSSVN